ncbi:methylenetetrahydrofolate reductase [NAD(P)H] [Marispirochaeta sp.]|uniref:methylenetetrahydrofolate reductase [NAD(P)H] n=1 Tax=Marispirochaeta sp. TaxID=2038653 RepID=UPI0029C83F53|nr:methylenetetrahydrofolate reductase [NAD(P)H] [Marispirochaeta sp.]
MSLPGNQRTNHPSISFEFFPPKTEKGFTVLKKRIIEDFVPLKPSYVSITYGAGGSTLELTRETTLAIKKEAGLPVVSHLTCVGASRDDIALVVDEYMDAGITNILALRGDPPKERAEVPGDFAYAAELVRFVKKRAPGMNIGVAGFPEGHPATPNRLIEMDHLKAKVDAGADYICTQLFFDNRDFFDFTERCRIAGINVPVIAGIMPVVSRSNLQRMAELSPGTRFPAGLLKSVARTRSDEQVERVGIHWATQQVMELLASDVAGIHLYTLNQSRAVLDIYRALGIEDSRQL